MKTTTCLWNYLNHAKRWSSIGQCYQSLHGLGRSYTRISYIYSHHMGNRCAIAGDDHWMIREEIPSNHKSVQWWGKTRSSNRWKSRCRRSVWKTNICHQISFELFRCPRRNCSMWNILKKTHAINDFFSREYHETIPMTSKKSFVIKHLSKNHRRSEWSSPKLSPTILEMSMKAIHYQIRRENDNT